MVRQPHRLSYLALEPQLLHWQNGNNLSTDLLIGKMEIILVLISGHCYKDTVHKGLDTVSDI